MFVKFQSLTQLGGNKTRTENSTLQVQRSFQLNLPQIERELSNQMTHAIPSELIKQEMNSYLHVFLQSPNERGCLCPPRACAVNQSQCADVEWEEIPSIPGHAAGSWGLKEPAISFSALPTRLGPSFPMMLWGNRAGEAEAQLNSWLFSLLTGAV